ncbi:TetR/AcrR family transcriptional regulator [Aquimarina brevivitae]|uniref:TetR family transcriptional regulator n=1 Tax=Aquimarina brevivitae TaxID=323412 RepID=A0A4Q7P2B1_9FLAO|nr:TetR/AcrR family transcriptional regulator [Aquimarina brevivitae]RZS93520.1 TetR family transcriptional regulator [Aquimarina brevivitae]
MGRKAIEKKRKVKSQKVEQWTQAILPKLVHTELGSLTIDDLSSLFNKSKSTVYQYFTSKEEIFEYITQVRIDSLKTYRKALHKNTKDYRNQYENLVDVLVKGAQDISPFYLNQLKIHFPTAWQIIEEFLMILLNDLKVFYTTEIQNKQFKPISVDLLCKLDEYFIRQLITDHHFFNNTDIVLGEMIKEYMYLKLEGLKA